VKCAACGHEATGNNFCWACGASITAKEKSKKLRPIADTLLFFVLVAALGAASGYYVASVGWDSVPAALGRARNLPFIRSQGMATRVFYEMSERAVESAVEHESPGQKMGP